MTSCRYVCFRWAIRSLYCFRGCNGSLFFFFFQAEDGIRDTSVTGVQTCALPISRGDRAVRRVRTRDRHPEEPVMKRIAIGVTLIVSILGLASADAQAPGKWVKLAPFPEPSEEIGRASCRERVEDSEGDVSRQEVI